MVFLREGQDYVYLYCIYTVFILPQSIFLPKFENHTKTVGALGLNDTNATYLLLHLPHLHCPPLTQTIERLKYNKMELLQFLLIIIYVQINFITHIQYRRVHPHPNCIFTRTIGGCFKYRYFPITHCSQPDSHRWCTVSASPRHGGTSGGTNPTSLIPPYSYTWGGGVGSGENLGNGYLILKKRGRLRPLRRMQLPRCMQLPRR